MSLPRICGYVLDAIIVLILFALVHINAGANMSGQHASHRKSKFLGIDR